MTDMEGKITKAVQTQSTAVAERKAPKTIQEYVERMMPEIKKALPSVMTPDRFARIVLSAISTNPKLAQCTPKSFLGAMMTSAQLGMEVNTPMGRAYLIPRNNRKTGELECQFQMGYLGMLDLAHRSEQIKDVQAHTVYANDDFVYEYGLEPKLTHKPAFSDRGDPIFFYAVFHTKAGGSGFEVMSIDDIRKHAAKYSDAVKSGRSSPWQTDFEAMAKKTVLKRLLKYAPMSTDYVRAAVSDETVKTTLSPDMFSEPDSSIEAQFSDVDPDTGEIKEDANVRE